LIIRNVSLASDASAMLKKEASIFILNNYIMILNTIILYMACRRK
jgi:hypothetical protein